MTKIQEWKESPVKNPYEGQDNHWYWFDETYLIIGPYPTKESAEEGLKFYIDWLEGGRPDFSGDFS